MTERVRVETAFGVVGVEATYAGVSRIRLPGDRSDSETSGDGRASAHAAAAAAQIREYVKGEREQFEVELDWSAIGPEQRRVLEELCAAAPFGTTITYGELGRRSGVDDPRDVGVLMARNPLPLVVPCHRVVATEGLGGYGGGLELKRRLLELEGVLPPRLDLDVG
jgi:methylated-DNA-[protein]-cysteine S-methyltransferase